MCSLFPGMDPYLEHHWRDVQHNLITFIQGALNSRLPEGLIARVEERIVLEPVPILCPAPELLNEGFIEILDVGSGNRVVTVIEVLSPTNKNPGDGQEQYLQKQRELLQTEANLVEIDLLRSGARVLLVAQDCLLPIHRTPYQICVRRGSRPRILEFYPVPLSKRLPRFRIPLRPTDTDIALDLQPLLDQCYRNGRYSATVDYKIEPDPPLGANDAKWADELLHAAGKR